MLLSPLLHKLEVQPDGVYLHLKGLKYFYQTNFVDKKYDNPICPNLECKLICLSETVLTPTVENNTPWQFESPEYRKEIALTEISKSLMYHELLHYLIGVVLDYKQTPNGHIWLVFRPDSAVSIIQTDPVLILKFQGQKRGGNIITTIVEDFPDIINVSLEDLVPSDSHEMPPTRINMIALAIFHHFNPQMATGFLAEKKL